MYDRLGYVIDSISDALVFEIGDQLDLLVDVLGRSAQHFGRQAAHARPVRRADPDPPLASRARPGAGQPLQATAC